MVYWITGLSGVGKTTIGTALCQKLKEKEPATVLLDGDELREIFSDQIGYHREGRYTYAMRYARMCRLLAAQGITVVCCTISLFHEVHEWNRESIPGYFEIYLTAPKELRYERKREIYGADTGNKSPIAGESLEIEEPLRPDLTIINDGTISISDCVKKIIDRTS